MKKIHENAKQIKKYFILLLVLFGFTANSFCGEIKFRDDAFESPFNFWGTADYILLGTAFAGGAGALIVEHNSSLPEWNGILLNADDVNAFDRWAMKPYDDTLHDISTVTCYFGLCGLPLILCGAEVLSGNMPFLEAVNDAVMYTEAFLLSFTIGEWIKIGFQRVRPYMYFEGYPEDKVEERDFELSFPSGHTIKAFLGASFTSTLFAYYFPESNWKIPVAVTSFSIAAVTGFLRVESGSHFLTDVLTGAAIGTVSGFIIPFLHHKIEGLKKQKVIPENVDASVSPMGINVRIKL